MQSPEAGLNVAVKMDWIDKSPWVSGGGEGVGSTKGRKGSPERRRGMRMGRQRQIRDVQGRPGKFQRNPCLQLGGTRDAGLGLGTWDLGLGLGLPVTWTALRAGSTEHPQLMGLKNRNAHAKEADGGDAARNLAFPIAWKGGLDLYKLEKPSALWAWK